jgi:hypothetical protein
MTSTYAILMETSGEHNESWLNFIRFQGNEEALKHLQHQLKKVEMYIIDDMSTFDLELNTLVSEQTAREMCLVDLNPYMPHRKFDGKLEKINLDLSKKDDNDEKIEKIHDLLGYGDIDNFIDGEDLFGRENDVSDDSDKEIDSDDDIEELRKRVEELTKKKEKELKKITSSSDQTTSSTSGSQ